MGVVAHEPDVLVSGVGGISDAADAFFAFDGGPAAVGLAEAALPGAAGMPKPAGEMGFWG
jgi:hypothetical protein